MNKVDVLQEITKLAEQPFDLAEFLYTRILRAARAEARPIQD
ncbi:hypothetical protein ACOTHJ_03005 [Achromobacter xylosoxidans]|nr:hypothetical protein [Achromobacter xylosoxidans]